MKLENKFNLGDKCFFVYSDYKIVNKECPECKEGIITTTKGRKFNCPECRGKGILNEELWFCGVAEEEVCCIWMNAVITKEVEESYLDYDFLGEAGTLYRIPQECVFLTKEEAELKADKMREEYDEERTD
jgi:hypothetical protein